MNTCAPEGGIRGNGVKETSIWGPLGAAGWFLAFVGSLCVFDLANVSAEDVTSSEVSAFIDTYYAVDRNDLGSPHRPYTTQASHNQEFAVNLGYADLTVKDEDYRARFALQDGTSVAANDAAEPKEFWQYVQEATAGYRLSDDLWFDAGVHLSHIGMESFISRDNINYTRSFVAEYSPYYQLGIKLGYQFRNNLFGCVHLLNGWQNISEQRDPALGLKLAYTMSPTVTLTYNNYWSGNEPGADAGSRLFNDVIVQWSPIESRATAFKFAHCL